MIDIVNKLGLLSAVRDARIERDDIEEVCRDQAIEGSAALAQSSGGTRCIDVPCAAEIDGIWTQGTMHVVLNNNDALIDHWVEWE